jgi:stress-induced morphogen
VVAKSDILTAKKAIENALNALTLQNVSAKVFVFETEWGHLRALIGSGGFTDVSLGERQKIVWDFLREKVPPECLMHLIAVHPMDLDEWHQNVSEVS